MQLTELLTTFLDQGKSGDLKTASYPKERDGFAMKTSFGMGAPARVPWIAFTAPEIKVSNGFYPVYLYYKALDKLILTYGISEGSDHLASWPEAAIADCQLISDYTDNDAPRYGDSYVFVAYEIAESEGVTRIVDANGALISNDTLEKHLDSILRTYAKAVEIELRSEDSVESKGLFYMEKQLEDFIIHNWEASEFGMSYDLIYENGELVSQQFATDIGRIDILAKEKTSGAFVVIELKRNQTSDDTVGQLARYMGWVSEKFDRQDVKGIIVAGSYDKKLDYATRMLPSCKVFIYNVSFTLSEHQSAAR